MRSPSLFLGFVALSCSMTVLAQEDAAQIERRFDEPQAPKSLPAAPAPKLIENGLPPAGADAIRFTLTAIELERDQASTIQKNWLNSTSLT